MMWKALLILPLTLFADFSKDFLKNYPNPYFVETGTCAGRGVRGAYRCGFRNIRSVELYPVPISQRKIPRRSTQIKLYKGDSGKKLPMMIADIDEQITFWLDAHQFPPKEGQKNCPILEELDAIAAHPIKTHTILIDDISGTGTLEFDYVTLDQIKERILQINPDYQITLVPGGWADEVPDNILVATP